MNKNSTAKKIQNLVSQGKLGEAIEFLKNNSEDQIEISLLSNRYNELNRKIGLDVIREAEATIERNKIASSLLKIADGNKEDATNNDRPKSNNAQRILAVCALLTLVFSLYIYFGNKQVNKKNTIPRMEEKEDSLIFIPKDTINGKIATPKPSKFKKTSNSKILNPIIRYKGKPIEKAYFMVEGCKGCKSSISNKSGEVKAEIPISLYESTNVFNFLIYSKDSLLYSKKMGFENLELNRY